MWNKWRGMNTFARHCTLLAISIHLSIRHSISQSISIHPFIILSIIYHSIIITIQPFFIQSTHPSLYPSMSSHDLFLYPPTYQINLSIYPLFYTAIHPSWIIPSICSSIHIYRSIHPSFCPSTSIHDLSIHPLSIHWSIHRSVVLSIHPSFHPSIVPSIHPSIHRFIHRSIHPFIVPSIHRLYLACTIKISVWCDGL